MNTPAPASVVPRGTEGAEPLPLARLVPPSEITEPGASGVFWTKLAEFTAAPITGAGAGSPNPPVTSRIPVSAPVGLLALTVRVTGPALDPETHVVLQDPPCPAAF